jgi:hypothetical protein
MSVCACAGVSCGQLAPGHDDLVGSEAGQRSDARADDALRDTAAGDAAMSEDVGAPDGDASEDARAPDGDASEDAGSEPDGALGITIRGRIIDSWRQPMPGWRVALGAESTSTDDEGQFTFANVTPPYDVSFMVPGVANTTNVPELWTYRGLTRPDPTLQPDWVLGPLRRDIRIERINAPTAMQDDGGAVPVNLDVSLGTRDLFGSGGGGPTGALLFNLRWSGDPSLSGTLHAMAWTRPNLEGLDNQYLSYREQPFTVVADDNLSAAAVQVTLDYSPSPVPVATFRAEVQSSWGSSSTDTRTVDGMVAFDDNAHFSLTWVEDTYKTSAIAAPMPLLPASHVVFAGRQGHAGLHARSFGCVHRVAPSPDVPVVLDIPEPRAPISPDEGAMGIDAATLFEWSAAPVVSVLSATCWNAQIRLHTVTSESRAQLPSVPALGAGPPTGADCVWHVDVHGAYASVDEASGPRGMIDPCADIGNIDRGNFLDDGSVTISDWRAFQTAP